MSSTGDQINLDLCLAQVANPLDVEVNTEAVNQLVHLMKDDKETIGFVLRFFAHKIQSPHELEALKALNVIQTLVKRADRKFIEEVGKFRFLNEMIKVISPKYLASRSPEKVKKKTIELLYLWSVELKHEPKIFEAYQMLKRQGIVASDPTHLLPETKQMPPPPPRPKDEIWDNAENALMLKRLIQSGQPEDRIAANKLIKMLAHQADKKTEIKSRCQTELELARNNARLFSEVLANFNSPRDENFTEKDLLDELYDSCKKLRPKLFKLAGELPETEPLFEELLKVNDELTKVINGYDVKMQLVPQTSKNSLIPDLHNQQSNSCSNLLLDNSPIKTTIRQEIDLVDISSPGPGPSSSSSSSSQMIKETCADIESLQTHSNTTNITTNIGDVSLLSDHETIKDSCNNNAQPAPVSILTSSQNISALLETFPKTEVVNAHVNYLKDILVPCMPKPPSISSLDLISSISTSSPTATTSIPDSCTNKSPKRSTACLDELENLMRITLNAGPKPDNSGDSNIPLNALRNMSMLNNIAIVKQSNISQVTGVNSINSNECSAEDTESHLLLQLSSSPESISNDVLNQSASPPSIDSLPPSIADIFIPIESIEPSERSPIILVNEKEIKSILNFGANQPRPDVSVAVLTSTNLSNKSISKIFFKFTSSKGMRFKYQAPSSTTLPPSNPFLPPSAIIQVIIFAKISAVKKEKCQFRLEYSSGSENFVKTGSVDL